MWIPGSFLYMKMVIQDKIMSEEILVRLNKYLSDCGYCSRREADRLVEAGKVTVDGHKAVMGEKISPDSKVLVEGKPLKQKDRFALIAVNKPVGIECTTDAGNPDNIVDFVHYPTRVYPVGRLDKNSHGLILMTNDGSIVNKILKASEYHEKEYVVRVNKPVTKEFLIQMRNGVPILGTTTRPCKVKKTGEKEFEIILTQGLNRQIRRMCEYLGYRVLDLKRIRIMNIQLGRLKEGTYRNVTKEELRVLLEIVQNQADLSQNM